MSQFLLTQSFYLPQQQCLLLHANLSDFLIDFYLNLQEKGLAPSAKQVEQLKDLFAYLSLHLASRAPDETVAWTVHMQGDPPYSLFATGCSADGYLIGQIITDDIRETDTTLFHSQVSRPQGESRRSVVMHDGTELADAVAAFYRESEQTQMTFHISADSDEAFALAAMPDYDTQWFSEAEPRKVFEQRDQLQAKLLKENRFEFRCDCSVEKLLPFFETIDDATLEDIYGDSPSVTVQCPRCAKTFDILRSTLKRNLN